MAKNKKISVVIPCVNGLPYIRECLRSLRQQENYAVAEVIVADSSDEATRDWIANKFPDVILLRQDYMTAIPNLKAKGIAEAKGDILVMLEDHCVAPENWFDEIIKAHDSEYIAIGGAVENGCAGTILDWATFFCEYGAFLLPVPDGPVDMLPGNNVSYKRETLLRVAGELINEGLWEGFLHDELKSKGYILASNPAIVVVHKKGFGLFEFLAQRFYYSRTFAGMRNEIFSNGRRAFYFLGSWLLPLILFPRLVRVLMSKRRLNKEIALSLPYLFIFTIAWALGESWGYLLGPGQSMIKIK